MVLLMGAVLSAAASAEDYAFTVQPAVGNLNAASKTYPVTWQTNFTPYKVEIVKLDVMYGVTTETVIWSRETGLSMNGSAAVPGEYGGSTVRVKAYIGETI